MDNGLADLTADLSTATYHGLARMGPTFGTMFLSGRMVISAVPDKLSIDTTVVNYGTPVPVND